MAASGLGRRRPTTCHATSPQLARSVVRRRGAFTEAPQTAFFTCLEPLFQLYYRCWIIGFSLKKVCLDRDCVQKGLKTAGGRRDRPKKLCAQYGRGHAERKRSQ
jgi:hypothetical protein